MSQAIKLLSFCFFLTASCVSGNGNAAQKVRLLAELKIDQIELTIRNVGSEEIILEEDKILHVFPGVYGIEAVVDDVSGVRRKRCSIANDDEQDQVLKLKVGASMNEAYSVRLLAHAFCLEEGRYFVTFRLSQDKIIAGSNKLSFVVSKHE